MPGKVRFGCDYLHLMRQLQLQDSNAKQIMPISDAAAKLFLHNWGLEVKDIDEANKLFFEKADKQSLGSAADALDRIAMHIRGDTDKVEQLIIEAAAIASMDFDFTKEEASIFLIFQSVFDLRQSEIEECIENGYGVAMLLNNFGENFKRYK